jgi:hypothetical protein
VGYEELHARLEENDQEILARAVLASETEDAGISLQQGEECLRSLERSSTKAQHAQLKTRIKDAERAGNITEALRLAKELRQMEMPD